MGSSWRTCTLEVSIPVQQKDPQEPRGPIRACNGWHPPFHPSGTGQTLQPTVYGYILILLLAGSEAQQCFAACWRAVSTSPHFLENKGLWSANLRRRLGRGRACRDVACRRERHRTPTTSLLPKYVHNYLGPLRTGLAMAMVTAEAAARTSRQAHTAGRKWHEPPAALPTHPRCRIADVKMWPVRYAGLSLCLPGLGCRTSQVRALHVTTSSEGPRTGLPTPTGELTASSSSGTRQEAIPASVVSGGEVAGCYESLHACPSVLLGSIGKAQQSSSMCSSSETTVGRQMKIQPRCNVVSLARPS